MRDDDVRATAAARLLVVRADGLWAELLCETPDEHWSFGLEAFGVRFDDRDEARDERPSASGSPVGFDLEWETPDHVVGELLVGRAALPFDGTGTFEHVADRRAATRRLGGRGSR